MAYKLTQVRLLVTDFPACFRFYRDTLGFKANYGSEDDWYAIFDTGTVQLELLKRESMMEAIGASLQPPAVATPDVVSLGVGVENVDAAAAELKAKGVPLVAPPTDRPMWGARTAHFRDPAGNLIELWQRLPASS